MARLEGVNRNIRLPLHHAKLFDRIRRSEHKYKVITQHAKLDDKIRRYEQKYNVITAPCQAVWQDYKVNRNIM